ncbi:protein of unknown function DUF500 [Desulfarculus baarsii DSM 2075]|uniref:Ysc84 actin-binding domain-containing protein n=1 Tax=Desulfarculus baarsii (strain ATCC 33931 / DSM 2075 / LMG 7858 / VKM B-1802 / 2st14) TaxID=644282 RepID=E1QFJ6_DESB2|nr:lipid-binding SYLF domain-containing protein [Desulfarculus baarsii]ADK84332.1 protein of unknown function DUF500 [Desulfarculus baarsii DSM 2075]
MTRKFLTALATLAVLALTALAPGCATPTFVSNAHDAELVVRRAHLVLLEAAEAPDADAARYLLRRAKAVAIFPGTLRVGLIFGGKLGMGVVLVRQADGAWSPPAFFHMGAASIGFQAGAQSADLLMVIMTDKGLSGVMRNKLQLGVDASAAAGPLGRQTEASLAAANMRADVYSYSRAQGLFAGASLQSVVIEADAEADDLYYNADASNEDILNNRIGDAPASAAELRQALARLSD